MSVICALVYWPNKWLGNSYLSLVLHPCSVLEPKLVVWKILSFSRPSFMQCSIAQTGRLWNLLCRLSVILCRALLPNEVVLEMISVCCPTFVHFSTAQTNGLGRDVFLLTIIYALLCSSNNLFWDCCLSVIRHAVVNSPNDFIYFNIICHLNIFLRFWGDFLCNTTRNKYKFEAYLP